MTPPARPQQVLDAVTAGALVVLVIPSLRPLFAGAGASWLLLAAAIPVAVAVASILAGRPQGSGASRRAGAGAGIGFGPAMRLGVDVAALVAVLAAIPADPEGRSPLGGLRSGVTHLLTSALPLPAGGPELGIIVVATALAAGVAAELTVRTGSALAPSVPSVVLYGAALAVGAGGLPAPAWDAPALVAAAAVAILLRRLAPLDRPAGEQMSGPTVAGARRPGRRTPWTRIGAGIGVAAVAAAVAVPLGSHLPGASSPVRYDLRAALQPAGAAPAGLNPLVTYAAVYDGAPHPALSVRVSGASPSDLYWRLDVLDHFSGTGWSSTARLLRGGTTLPPGPRLDVPTTAVVADVHLDAPDTFLPAPDRPVDVSLPGLDVAAGDGVLAVPPGAPQPSGYRVHSEVPDPGRQALLAATPAAGSDPGSPSLPYAIQSVASSVVAAVPPTPFARLTAISSYLTGPGFVRHPPGGSPIGSGTYQVLALLHDRDGSSEQYAAAFALLARAIGFQTRLAIGYLGGTASAAGSAITFTTRDLAVWPEVDFRGLGWLPWPTVPATGTGATRSGAPSMSSSVGQAIAEQRALDGAGPPAAAKAPVTPARIHHHAAGGGPGPLGWGLVALAGLVVVPALLLGAKSGRRYRQRRRGDARAQVSGAWEFVLDRLAERGVDVPASLTAPEVAASAAAALGPARTGSIAALVALVDGGRFDRRRPTDAATADAAWALAVEVERALRSELPARLRVRALLSPAPWTRSRRPSPGVQPGAATTKIRRKGNRVSPVGSGG